MAGVFPLRLETTGQIASQVAELLLYDLPEDYHATYRERIRSVTRDDALEAARRCIRPDEITVVIGGDADVVRGPLEELGLGPVEVEKA
jgi:predicted Zn-dependent peptidase